MRALVLSILLLIISLTTPAQTPFDSFASEAYRPMLGLRELKSTENGTQQAMSQDTSVILNDDVSKWLSVDPMADKYPDISPYAYCNWNPIKHVDPDGRDWYEADGEIKWTELKSQQAMDEAKLAGKYLGEAVAVFNGYRNEHLGTKNGRGKYLGGDDAKLADVILYGPKGSDDITMGLKGFTMTSDYDKYGAIDNGTWPANYDTKGKGGKIESHWTLNYRGFIPTYDYQPNMSPYAGELKGTMYKNGIFIHSTMGPDNRVGATTSTGCLLLDWNSMQIFNEKMTGVRHFSVQVKRN